MKVKTKLKFMLCIIFLSVFVLSGCQKTKESKTDIELAEKQRAAMELGYACGSKLSLIVLPVPMRQNSFAQLTYNADEISTILLKLDLKPEEANNFVNDLQQSIKIENSLTAANMLLEKLNYMKELLQSNKYQKLSNIYRIGFVLGNTLETSSFIMSGSLKGTTTATHLNQLVATFQRFRASMPDDIAQSGLPDDLKEAIRKTNIEVTSIDDLNKIIDACKDVLQKAKKLNASSYDGETTWTKHQHPHGFTFLYPHDWTVQDDPQNKSILLLPPGITLESPGPKAIYLIRATHGYSDPFSTRSYFERELAGAELRNFTQTSFTEGNKKVALLNWKVFIPSSNTNSDYRIFVTVINDWAIHVEGIGPKEIMELYDAKILKLMGSLEWI